MGHWDGDGQEAAATGVQSGLANLPSLTFSASLRYASLIPSKQRQEQIANSVMMFHFCELDAAARVRPRASSQHPAPRTAASLDRGGSTGMSPAGSLAASAGAGALPGPDSSPLHSYAPSWSGSEASELYADSSSSSLAAVAAAAGVGVALGDSPAHPPSHLHQHTHQPRLTPPRVQAAGLHATSDTQSDGGSGQAQAMLPVGASLSGIGSGGHLRLALPVQQRGATKAAARLLREQLAVAQADLQGEGEMVAVVLFLLSSAASAPAHCTAVGKLTVLLCPPASQCRRCSDHRS